MKNAVAPPSAPQGAASYLASEVALYVRFADVDMMQVVHHAAYIHWFEQIRFQFLSRILGIGRDEFMRYEVSLPLIRCDARYHRSFRFFDEPLGYARLQLFKQAKVAVHYAVFKPGSPSPGVTGTTTHCFTGPGERLLLRTPDFIAAAITRAKTNVPGCFLTEGDDYGSWRIDHS